MTPSNSTTAGLRMRFKVVDCRDIARFLSLPLILWVLLCEGIDRNDLFPFDETDQQLPAADDSSSLQVKLSHPISFYDQSHQAIYINNDGILTFLAEVPTFVSVSFPLNFPAIAPLYADVDLSHGGGVYYRETNDTLLLDRVDREIGNNFPAYSTYSSKSLFIATFANVSSFKQEASVPANTTNATNTVQVILSTNGQDSFAMFLFPDGGIGWLRGEGKVKNLPDAKAQSGFSAADGRFLTLPSSGTDQVLNYDKMSNLVVPQAGVWLFRIGETGTGGIEQPVQPVIDRETCTRTRSPCPPTASCTDRERGYCCSCKGDLIGNGISCIARSEAQRINGKLTGTINDIALSRTEGGSNELISVELHSYVVPEEGRCYTALSQVPRDLIVSMQTLVAVGDVVGWLFAKSTPSLPNGFTLTGGKFNRSVEIEFPTSGDRISITESFLGHDVFSNIQTLVDIRGRLPEIATGSKIQFDDSAEEYAMSSVVRDQVTIRSRSAKKYKLENGMEIPFTVDQTITYHQCPHRTYSELPPAIRLEVSKSFVMYDEAESVVRLSGSFRTSDVLSQDICIASRTVCGDHSSCVVDGTSPRCICDRGFQSTPQSSSCQDVNECLVNRHRCHQNADCLNTLGSYVCRCRPGSIGDGFTCQQSLSCESIRCDPNADCMIRDGKPECRCRKGWAGNGFMCLRHDNSTQSDCHQAAPSPCDPNADCLPDNSQDDSPTPTGTVDPVHRCFCRQGFYGNGLTCSADVLQCEHPCGSNAVCMLNQTASQYQCMCLPGTIGDGYTCVTASHACQEDSECDPKAQCLPSLIASQQRTCKCMEGFVGDGKSCSKAELDRSELDCKVNKVCALDADCLFNESEQRFACKCNDGFIGNGLLCTPRRPCITDPECPVNGRCQVSATSGQGYCQCNPGYNKTAVIHFECTPLPNAPCNLVPNCAENAVCSLNQKMRRHECQCKRGYRGNGTICEKSVIPCNILNNCDVRAKCGYSMVERGFRCKCRDGYIGDGLSCQPNRPCNEDPQQCDANADCVAFPHLNSHSCQCRHSFVGDGLQCSATPSYDGDYLIFSQGMSLLRLPLHPSEGNPGQLLLTKSPQTPISLDVDCFEGFIYWSDVTMKTIRRTPYNGSFSEVLLSGAGSPEGISIDWVSRDIYWIDTAKDVIYVARLDAITRKKIVISEGLHDPRDVAVHPGLGKIYWSDWHRTAPSIQYSNTDGSDRGILIASDLALPNMLTIDFQANDICWTDAGLHRIECADLGGSNRRVVYTPAEYPFGLTIQGDLMFWTDWKSNTVERASRRGGQAVSLKVPPGGNGKMYDIVTVPRQCPQMSNACAVSNGGCRPPADICLPNARGRTCACPDFSNSTTESGADTCSQLT